MSPFNGVMVDCSKKSGGNDQEEEYFKRFDMAIDDSDHYFLNKNNPGGDYWFTNTSSKVYKRIMKERKTLEKKLPESIAVRVYKHRIDLFRAVIVGAPGTPCHDGLFVFDFAFPSDYPLRPPKFCFRLFAPKERNVRVLVPNSWWGGKLHKKCNPSKSMVLQVLLQLQNKLPEWVLTVHLQGGVVDEKPVVLKETAVANKEDVFVASCQRMLFLVQNPPKNFEAFVADHFHKRGTVVLKACKVYKKGYVRVGDYREDEQVYDGSVAVKVSDAFKASIETLYPLLFTAFMEDGVSLRNFIKQIELDLQTASFDSVAADKVKHGISNKMVGAMMKFFGLNKKLNVKGLNKCPI